MLIILLCHNILQVITIYRNCDYKQPALLPRSLGKAALMHMLPKHRQCSSLTAAINYDYTAESQLHMGQECAL